LERLVELRGRAISPIPLKERIEVEREISRLIGRLLAVVEQYPRLTSSEHLMNVMRNLRDVETQIADRRELYNEACYHYNSYQKFPCKPCRFRIRF